MPDKIAPSKIFDKYFFGSKYQISGAPANGLRGGGNGVRYGEGTLLEY